MESVFYFLFLKSYHHNHFSYCKAISHFFFSSKYLSPTTSIKEKERMNLNNIKKIQKKNRIIFLFLRERLFLQEESSFFLQKFLSIYLKISHFLKTIYFWSFSK